MSDQSRINEPNTTRDGKPVTQGPEMPGERSVYDVAAEKRYRFGSPRNRNIAIVTLVVIFAIVVVLALVEWTRDDPKHTNVKVNTEAGEAGHEDEHAGDEIKLSPEALAATAIEIEGVTQRPAVALIRVTGTVETNQQQSQQATPLVSGRVERVNVGQGDVVRAGSVLAVISSPEIAEMHGKLHEAETARALAERNLQRVQRAENRVAVLSARARLEETEATLKRTRRLIELGAGAGKDLIAAEAAFKTAKANFDFQSNISLNRELQEAAAAVETTRVDVSHIRDQLRALGVSVPEGERHDHSKDTSLVALRSPASGTVVERSVNAGAGIQAGTPLFTIANISSVWVIANVPEAQVGSIRVGTPAEVRSAGLGDNAIAGRVNYIDPRLNEETRTARVRIEVANPGERLKSGMFVQVGFQASSGTAGEELMVRSEAVQRIGDRNVVFIPQEGEAGSFVVRDVELGGVADGYQRVLSGLQVGERVVTKGSFTLKTQMLKSSMGDEH
ncbi:MAG TPA: efflux RND transporter periplasmic adaptor subunit [Pyrinomonadaceae bacterium]|nr:efflux RND transporter periplasmic adaptor subunit [Pyrinomonadaceae bacterium]